LDKVEERVEEQEQYSRRTSLGFNNVRVPTNSNGDIIQPIDTDSIVLQICKNQHGVKSCTSCTSEQGGGSELDASQLGCSGVVGLEFNLACFCTWSRDGDMLSGLSAYIVTFCDFVDDKGL
jgi:hypothetical protein